MERIMINDKSGHKVKVKDGFSWTTLFFGELVPLARGDLKWFAIMIIATIVTAGISHVVFPFTYNKLYIKDLQNKGYRFML